MESHCGCAGSSDSCRFDSQRRCVLDFDGTEFYRNVTNCNQIDDEMIKKFAPNVVEGVSKLSNWAKNL